MELNDFDFLFLFEKRIHTAPYRRPLSITGSIALTDTKHFSQESFGYMRLSQILKLIPVSKATWWNGCKTGQFPKPYKLGPRITAWKTSDIYQCLQQFQLSRENKSG